MNSKTITNIARFKDIGLILLRFGFHDVVERLDFPGKEYFDISSAGSESQTLWERIRRVLEELGPGFIKIGQILSLRPDIIPEELLFELRKLQDEVPPEPFEHIEEQLEEELGDKLETIFSFFDKKPLAGASLSQVHRAILRQNREVVAVKVQRPGIIKTIHADLDILKEIARQLHERFEAVAPYNLPALVQEISKSLLREIDFLYEARTMRIVRNNFLDEKSVHIPKVYAEYTTSTVLTMELIVGEHLDDLLQTPIENRKKLAVSGLNLMIKQIFLDGLFHADPHPGNILIIDHSVFCLLDWGMVGRLTQHSRIRVLDLIEATIDKDSPRLLEIILDLTKGQRPADMKQLERDIMDVLDTYSCEPLHNIHIGKLMLELSTIVRQNHLRLPIDLAVMIKALLTVEGTARQLYPDLDVIREAEPFIRRIARERKHPKVIWKSFVRLLQQYVRLYRGLPDQLGHIFDKLVQGELAIRFKHDHLHDMLRTVENASNRLTFGIIIGALIIGSSMIITTGVKPYLFGYPVLGIIGYLISGVLGLWLVFNIIRKRGL